MATFETVQERLMKVTRLTERCSEEFQNNYGLLTDEQLAEWEAKAQPREMMNMYRTTQLTIVKHSERTPTIFDFDLYIELLDTLYESMSAAHQVFMRMANASDR